MKFPFFKDKKAAMPGTGQTKGGAELPTKSAAELASSSQLKDALEKNKLASDHLKLTEDHAKHPTEKHTTTMPAASVTPEKKSPFAFFKKKKPADNKLSKTPSLDSFSIPKPKKEKLNHRKLLRKYLDRAGYEETNEITLTKRVFNVIIAICVILTAALLILAVVNKPGTLGPTVIIIGLWTAVFALLLIVAFFSLYLFLDLRMFSRKQEIEEVLPDFLQLTSANISAGMPLDRALFFAVRPQFGILAKEIEEVAKATVAGEDLGLALIHFADRYDSVMLRRSVNIILEGMHAGGEMGDLLNKIAINIQELRLMKKEMAANVTTYVIFIGAATIIGAPLLFALSTSLASVIQQVVSGIDLGGSAGATGITFALNPKAVNIRDFKIFSVLALTTTSIFSASIINVIRKGSVKEGIKFIPIFIVVTITLYFLGVWVLQSLFSGFF
jgi:pilus assembly protein TadC